MTMLWLIGTIPLGASPAPQERQVPITGEARPDTMTSAGRTVTINQAASATVVSSTFNSDRESWTGGTFPDGGPYDQVNMTVTPAWHATAGNPGGAIFLDDPDSWTFFFGAPVAYLGDKSTWYGGQLRFDVKVEGTGFVFDEPDVILLGGGLVLVYDHATDPSSTWSRASVSLTEAGWRINTLAGSVPTRAQFQSALANITALRIRGEFINGGDTGYLDNVSLSPPVTLTLSPAALNFGAVNDGGTLTSVTPPQVVTVQQSAWTDVAWTATANVPWLTIAAADANGTGTGTFTVALTNPGGMLPATGTVQGTITITAPGAAANPTIPVTATLAAPGSTALPFGQVDTPAQNAAGIQGAIGVTGWALDDLGVTSVTIYRNCLPFENQAACQTVEGRSLVFVGNAAILPGARPDLEAAFATTPQNVRAGWGFLLLTNMLPDVTNQQAYGGQGPIALYVYATDVEGHRSLLGRTYVENPPQPTAITLANAGIAKPFGAIDTPGQGATVSGVLANFGWALTPDTDTVAADGRAGVTLAGGAFARGVPTPGVSTADATDILIPPNGSTMIVFLDGVATAAVSYNHCRGTVGTPPAAGVFCNDDIGMVFGYPTPQAPPPPFVARTANPTRFRNLDAGRGAIGAYTIDTTQLTNGLHTIAWSVTDSAGRTEGIGSRFFQVLNTGTRDRGPGTGWTTVGRVRRTRQASAGSASRPYRTAGRITAEMGARVFPDPGTRNPDPAVRVRTGFNLNAPFVPLTPDADGVYHVRLGDLDRLELHLGSVADGYLLVGDSGNTSFRGREAEPGIQRGMRVPGFADIERHDLPVGAHLDPDAGVFTWAPPPGYLGTYRLAFGRARSTNAPSSGGLSEPALPHHSAFVIDVAIAPRTPPAPGEPVIRMHLDAPADGATLSGAFTVSGWAVDPEAGLGSGIGAVHVWAQRADVAGAPPVFLGAAELGSSRPDVTAEFGAQFDPAGFRMAAATGILPAGAYTITAYAWNIGTARWEDARTVRVIVR